MPALGHDLNLANTSILVRYARADALGQQIEGKYRLLTSNNGNKPLISIVSVGEMRSLMLLWQWGAKKRRNLDLLLAEFIVIPLELSGVVDSYAEIDYFARKNGLAYSKNDLWIAATARATGARLLTTDKDFDPLDPGFITRDYIAP